MNRLTRYLRERRLRRLKAKREGWLSASNTSRRNAQEYAIKAYYMDQMATPMAWGRMQNAANWARHAERVYRDKADELYREIQALELELLP